jgi:hemolysin III
VSVETEQPSRPPDDRQAETAPANPPKPYMRGRLHVVAFFVSLPAGIALILIAQGPLATIAATVYAVSLAGLFGSSASYHIFNWSPKALARMKRLDHSMIFVLIAGTYTPFALLVVGPPWGWVLLTVVWLGVATGIALKLIRIDGFQTITGALYVTLGWMGIIILPQLWKGLSGTAVALIVAGGMIYTAGVLVLRWRKPDPSPKWFGYHEVWHVATIGAAVCFYIVILLMLLQNR